VRRFSLSHTGSYSLSTNNPEICRISREGVKTQILKHHRKLLDKLRRKCRVK